MSRMFLPGPVPVHHDVITAFRRRPESHRAASFGRELDQARRRLSALLHVPSIALLLGSGTLAIARSAEYKAASSSLLRVTFASAFHTGSANVNAAVG